MDEMNKVVVHWGTHCGNWEIEAVCEVGDDGASIDRVRLNGFDVPPEILTDEISAYVANEAWDLVNDIDYRVDYEYEKLRDAV